MSPQRIPESGKTSSLTDTTLSYLNLAGYHLSYFPITSAVFRAFSRSLFVAISAVSAAFAPSLPFHPVRTFGLNQDNA
jgi:hypothetical protein